MSKEEKALLVAVAKKLAGKYPDVRQALNEMFDAEILERANKRSDLRATIRSLMDENL